MEQTTQQIIQKPSLPIKTKIAAGLITIIGGLGILYALFGIPFLWEKYIIKSYETVANFIAIFVILPLSILFFLSGLFFLITRKKWAWWLIITISSISSILGLYFVILAPSEIDLIFPLLFPIVPFIFLLLDRKNFWEIAS